MNKLHPIFTTVTQCLDCYKCVRQCPVKAIRVESNHASVIPELCISCGRCVDICPSNAKSIRDDMGRTKLLLGSTRRVVASVAPSWICEFPELGEHALVAALKALGFFGAGETALGARAISQQISHKLTTAKSGLLISSACPAVVQWIRKYQGELTDSITQICSPLLAHCRIMRQQLGDDIAVVFFGPCIAKKLEADENPETLNVALTFRDLRTMFAQAGIDPYEFEHNAEINTNSPNPWICGASDKGRLYPAEGGMLRSLENTENAELLSISGVMDLQAELEGAIDTARNKAVFLEALACSGGCINGPAISNAHRGGLRRKMQVFSQDRQAGRDETAQYDFSASYKRQYLPHKLYSEQAITEALGRVDKYVDDDELNCGGCGYETCREFAAAMLGEKAEPQMCVSFMRKQAQRKANALLRSIPSGVVIVDRQLKIIECNKPFAHMFDDSTREAFSSLNSLEGADLRKIVPFTELFLLTLGDGQDICRENYIAGDHVLNLTIFSIQSGQIAGAVIQDVTEIQWRRQQVANNAREVLRRNLATVQEIAHKLGEHMADNEILLNSIASSYDDEYDKEVK